MFFPFLRVFPAKLPINPIELAVSGICTAFFDTLLQMLHQCNAVNLPKDTHERGIVYFVYFLLLSLKQSQKIKLFIFQICRTSCNFFHHFPSNRLSYFDLCKSWKVLTKM